MSRNKSPLATLDTGAATRHVLDHDVSELLTGAEVVRERRRGSLAVEPGAPLPDLGTHASWSSHSGDCLR